MDVRLSESMLARTLLCTLSQAFAALQPWHTATVDYSAANEYVSAHYPLLHAGGYFVTREPTGFSREPIFNARQGIYDDASGKLAPASLASCGFGLLSPYASERLSDWTDAAAVRSKYLPELRRVITKAVETSPEHGTVAQLIFWHMLLREEGSTYVGPSDPSYATVTTGPIAGMVHVDTDVNAYAGDAARLARIVLANQVTEEGDAPSCDDLARMLTRKRFCILNAWTNADPDVPVLRAPLALLAGMYPTVAGKLARFPEHPPDPQRSRWYAFPRMQEEVLCFTQYDRKLGRPSEIWHCAVPEVVEAADAPPRRSFEVRALVVLDEELPVRLDRWRPLEHTRPTLSHSESGEFCDEQACKRKR